MNPSQAPTPPFTPAERQAIIEIAKAQIERFAPKGGDKEDDEHERPLL